MEPKTIQHIDEPERHDPVSPRQVAPWQHVELEDNFDRRQLVRNLAAQHPDASADEIARMLKERQIDVSSTLILQELSRSIRR
ncbi:MAG TPA: hypothetical protein VFI31_25785 [Pirellulales bacterium]|nr:hypothetical protein [Pirellulales bacterium]